MSFPSPTELANLPLLSEFLRCREWEGDFDQRSLQRSRSYLGSAILSIDIDLPAVPEDAQINASVRGSDIIPYSVSISFTMTEWGPEFSNRCSCPVGHDCKHAAAVLGRLALIAQSAPARKTLGHGPSAPALTREIRHWLERLERSAASVSRANKPAANQFLAYCIEPDLRFSGNLHRLVLRPAARFKNGEINIKDSEARADPLNPSACMGPEDIPLAAMFHGLQKNNTYSYGSLRGPGWTGLILGALELNRLFHALLTEDDFDGADHHPLTLAPAVTAEPAWETLADGSAEPVIRLPDPQLLFLPTDPPLALDPERHRIGPVESSLPPSLLNTWWAGKSVAAQEVPLLGDRLSALASPSALPSPKELPVEHLSGLQPVPHLSIQSAEIGKWQVFDTIIGELSYRYGESPLLYPLTGKGDGRVSWLQKDTRYVLDRNRAAEKKLEMSLHKLGLIGLHSLFQTRDLDPKTRHAVTVEHPFPTLESAWLEFLDEHADSLRAAGWVIEIDPRSGLIVHDLTGFVPAIATDPDHGIDWFRFDLHGQFADQEISLIPFIAEAILQGLPNPDDEDLPEEYLLPCANPEDGHLRFPARRFLEICHHVAHLFHGNSGTEGQPVAIDRLTAAGLADSLEIDDSGTNRALAALGRRLRDIESLPARKPPAALKADLRPYQLDGYRWLRFLRETNLNGILADDMGLGKTVQTLALLASGKRSRDRNPSLVVAPTSVIGNWVAEAARFTPRLKVLLLHGSQRAAHFDRIAASDLVVTSYPLLARDHETLVAQEWETVVLDEAQYIKNPKTAAAQRACELKAAHRLCLSGTPMENHLGELWSLMRFLMPGFLGDEKSFGSLIRRPIERHQDTGAQRALSRRIAPLILRRTKDEVASDLPPKTELVHSIPLGKKESDLYESVRAAMDQRVREALAAKGLAKSHIIVLDALLKLRQICCHSSLLKTPAAQKVKDGSKLAFLTTRLLPELLSEGRRILLFSQFTSMLALIERELVTTEVPFLKLTGRTRNRTALVEQFQSGDHPLFLISLKAGGTGLNLTAADTVIHYDPWWNPAVESQATDRAHRIGQDKPVFVHKLICDGTIEERIVELQQRKSALVKALLSEETSKLKIDQETLSQLLAPME